MVRFKCERHHNLLVVQTAKVAKFYVADLNVVFSLGNTNFISV